jgi:hypothetical protein
MKIEKHYWNDLLQVYIMDLCKHQVLSLEGAANQALPHVCILLNNRAVYVSFRLQLSVHAVWSKSLVGN